VFGAWLTRIGLPAGMAMYRSGPLNRLGKSQGPAPMFGRAVRNVCWECNSGWMSKIEQIAQLELTDFITGGSGVISPERRGAIALWAQKTALVAMLLSSEEERAAGYGVPPSHYRAVFERREAQSPTLGSTFWIGQYTGKARQAVVWVTPVVVEIDGLREWPRPHGYAATIGLGELIIQGVWFTTPLPALVLFNGRKMPILWPDDEVASFPAGEPVDDASFLQFASGADLKTEYPSIQVSKWRPATDLPQSQLLGDMIALPVVCGKHVVFYPARIASAAVVGRHHAFVLSCACDITYLIHAENDGAEAIGQAYEALEGVELVLEDDHGVFYSKELGESQRPEGPQQASNT
jgi:hypothetical protein